MYFLYSNLEHLQSKFVGIDLAMKMREFVKSNSGLPSSMLESPSIPFVLNVKKVDFNAVEADKTELIKFDIFVDPKNPASRYSKEFVIFKDGGPEEWIKWLMGYRYFETSIAL